MFEYRWVFSFDRRMIFGNPLIYIYFTLAARPCCTGILGDCMLTSKEDCLRRRGIYHARAHLCSQVNREHEFVTKKRTSFLTFRSIAFKVSVVCWSSSSVNWTLRIVISVDVYYIFFIRSSTTWSSLSILDRHIHSRWVTHWYSLLIIHTFHCWLCWLG